MKMKLTGWHSLKKRSKGKAWNTRKHMSQGIYGMEYIGSIQKKADI